MKKPVYFTNERWDSYTTKKTIQKSKCSICLQPIKKLTKWDRLYLGLPTIARSVKEEENDSGIITLHCKHKFHMKCILKWLNNKNTCPNCRYKIISN